MPLDVNRIEKPVRKIRKLLKKMSVVMAEKPNQREFVQSLGEVKDAIGEWHDWEQLITIAKENLNHSNCQLVRELKKTADAKYEHALALTEAMRKKYLRVSHRRKGPSKHSRQGPAEPVWSATEALVA